MIEGVAPFRIVTRSKAICPYCKTRRIIRATCGDPACQVKRQHEKSHLWWKENGKIYNGQRSLRAGEIKHKS